MKLLHLDCSSGVAGDMLLGALLDAGVPEDAVRAPLAELNVPEWSLEITTVDRGGIRAGRVEVKIGDEPARSFQEIVAVIERAGLGAVGDAALAVFDRLGAAEAHAHGVPLDDLHLHEIGATDALIDVVGVCAAIAYLAPDRVTASAVAVGGGVVSTDHGHMPVPVPAVVALLDGIPIVGRGEVELATPTGAALVAHHCVGFGELPAMTLDASGSGAGAASWSGPIS